jgi:hypothetical protein
MRSLGPPRSTVFDGRVSDQDGADRQRTVEAAEAGAEASSCDRAQRRRRREGSMQLLQISSRSSSRPTWCAMACQWSTAPSRPSCSTGRVNSMGKLYLSRGGDVEKSTASQGDKRRCRLTPHEGLNSSSAQRPVDSANMYDDSCLPDDVFSAFPLP